MMYIYIYIYTYIPILVTDYGDPRRRGKCPAVCRTRARSVTLPSARKAYQHYAGRGGQAVVRRHQQRDRGIQAGVRG